MSLTTWLFPTFLAFQSVVMALVNSKLPGDYMDEIFHGPQAREYCRGAFDSWHPKITTFPGLYCLGTVYGWSRWFVHSLSKKPMDMDVACATPYLRSLNVLLSAACLLALRAILTTQQHQQQKQNKQQQQLQPQDSGAKQPQRASKRRGTRGTPPPSSSSSSCSPSLHALVLALYPLHWFFSFLYYTDVASLFFLLLCHLQASRRCYWGAALAGAVAVLCRQTNAVWAALVLGEAALAELGMLESASPPQQRTEAKQQGTKAGAAGAGGMIAGAKEAAAEVADAEEVAAAAAAGLLAELRLALERVWWHRGRLAAALWPLLIPPAGFVAFLASNDGSVVLGDKEAHKPVKHGAQLLYFAAWTGLMLWPQLLPALVTLADGARRRPLAAVVTAVTAVVAAAGVAHVSTLVHPYMLADNRHYVFYLWRRLIGRHAAVKYALAPVYVAALAALLAALRQRVSRLWILGFAACLVAQLLPAWLLELRYFTPGFFLIALRLQPPSRLQAAALAATYIAVNTATMFLFLYRPYTFADGSEARFLW